MFTYAEKSKAKRPKFVNNVARIPEEKRVRADEIGVDKLLVRECDRIPRGTKVEDVKRGQKFQRTNMTAAKNWQRVCSVAVLYKKVASRFLSNGFVSHF